MGRGHQTLCRCQYRHHHGPLRKEQQASRILKKMLLPLPAPDGAHAVFRYLSNQYAAAQRGSPTPQRLVLQRRTGLPFCAESGLLHDGLSASRAIAVMGRRMRGGVLPESFKQPPSPLENWLKWVGGLTLGRGCFYTCHQSCMVSWLKAQALTLGPTPTDTTDSIYSFQKEAVAHYDKPLPWLAATPSLLFDFLWFVIFQTVLIFLRFFGRLLRTFLAWKVNGVGLPRRSIPDGRRKVPPDSSDMLDNLPDFAAGIVP